jgi:hypothetical protein
MAKQTQTGQVKSGKVDTCKQATSLILDYLTQELDSQTALAFEEHLNDCPDCVAFLNTYKKTLELTQSFLRKK